MKSWLRSVCYTLPFVLIILSVYISWPWLHAGYVWHHSTIESLDSLSILSVNNTKIPRIIHQTFNDSHSIPLKWQNASNSCRVLHPNYQYMFWSDEAGRRLIEKEFPCILSIYDSYPYNIQRADVIRLVVLYVYGGIYIDFDIICLKSLDKLLNYDFILPKTKPVGLSNDFIISTPKHPFLFQVLTDLSKYNRNYFTKYITVMFSTGPMFLTHEASYYPDRSAIDTLSPEIYGKYNYNSSFSLFRHLKASSWHGKDASIAKWIYNSRNLILFILIIFIIMTFILIYFIPIYSDMIKRNNSPIVLVLNESKIKLQISKYRKYIQIMLFNFLFFLCFSIRFE